MSLPTVNAVHTWRQCRPLLVTTDAALAELAQEVVWTQVPESDRLHLHNLVCNGDQSPMTLAAVAEIAARLGTRT